MSVKLSQRLRVKPALTPQDISAAKTSPFVPIAGSRQILVAVTTGAVAIGKKVTVQLLQATDAAGAGSKPLGAAVEKVAAGAAGPLDLTVDATTERLDDGFAFVAVQLASDNGAAVSGAAVLILGDNRFNP